MSRIFKINRKPHDDCYIYKKASIELNPGVTILTGCNGCGKTTLLQIIKSKLQSSKIPVIYYSNETEGGSNAIAERAFYDDYSTVATLVQSSEGEQIYINLGNAASKIGKFVHSHENDKELWILFDAVDSGLSIDNILEIDKYLFKTILEDIKGKDVFIVCSTNAYELCKNNPCFDVYSGEYIEFKDYEDYKNYILKSRKQKDKRFK